MTIQELAHIQVRPRLLLTAFQWDGEPVEGWEFQGDGNKRRLIVPCYEGPREASVGDWISISTQGVPMVWSPMDFAQTYEIVHIEMSLWERVCCFFGNHRLWHKHDGAGFWTICKRCRKWLY